MISNQEKQRVRDAYNNRKPVRVPVSWGVNCRIVILDPRWNPEGVSWREYHNDGRIMVEMQRRFMDCQADYLSRYCDSPSGRPGEWTFGIDNQNFYDAAYFGCPVHFRDGQVPDVTPIFAGGDRDRIFDFDLDHPLDNPFIQECFRRHERLTDAVNKTTIDGVTLKVAPVMMGWDGPLTIATQLRGEEIFSDLIEDPDYALRMMRFIQRAAEIRCRALAERAGVPIFVGPSGWFADDSIQLIGLEMYRELLLPLHREWYALYGPGPHSIHLCGDATRHFPTIRRELNVTTFDTGFPVDHGWLRRELGPDVEIMGGPEIGLLMTGTPQQVFDRTKEILQSGIMDGGRFQLREANNLPPCVPEANLAAMYQCCLEHGNY